MKVAFLTAGGIAPCLSSSIGYFIKKYNEIDPSIELIAYKHGYKGLLKGDSIIINDVVRKNPDVLYDFGGSPIGNSRVKLSNVNDCLKNGYINHKEVPLEVASQQLVKDNVDVLHTIGGDDTNTTAAELVNYLSENSYNLTVVGLPKTIDNDVYPIKQTLGAYTAAEETARFFSNIVNENTTSSRQLIIHEVMGRNCGWLTAYSAFLYRKKMNQLSFLSDLNVSKDRWDIHGIFIPERKIDIENEIVRLRKVMNIHDCVNIFFSEGAALNSIISSLEQNGKDIKRDAFGHVRLDDINPGVWFADKLAKGINADKVLIQKSGYFARSASSNKKDLNLIFDSVDLAIECALNSKSGVVVIDEKIDQLTCIEFDRIRGGKPFDYCVDWFAKMLKDIKQTKEVS